MPTCLTLLGQPISRELVGNAICTLFERRKGVILLIEVESDERRVKGLSMRARPLERSA